METENPAPAWEDKEMSDVNSERSRLVAPPPGSPPGASAAAPAASWTLRWVNLAGLTLALTLTALVAYYAFMDGVTLFSYHPVAMTVGWMVMMPAAINSLRPGDPATSWLPLQLRSTRHWTLQAIAATLVSAGFLVIVLNKIIHNKNHFTSVHGVFGLVSIIFMAVTLSGGVGALYSLKLKKLLPPVYIKLIHGFAGLVTLSLGVTTLVLGLFSGIIKDEAAHWVGALLAIAVAVLTVLRPAIGMYVRLRERLGYVH